MVLEVDVAPGLVHGDVDEGYGAVADASRRNVAERGHIGAAGVVHRNGREVVDLWGGYRDAVRWTPWGSDTVVTMSSTSEGVAAATMAPAHARCLLEYDRTVADCWPEFA